MYRGCARLDVPVYTAGLQLGHPASESLADRVLGGGVIYADHRREGCDEESAPAGGLGARGARALARGRRHTRAKRGSKVRGEVARQ